MDQTDAISAQMPQVIGAAHFNDGHCYADFDPDLDEVAA